MSSRRSAWLWALTLAASACGASAPAVAGDVGRGRELFLRDWMPDDPRSHGGDGLGPVYNDTSCVACHFQGGPGGAGPSSKNVELVTAVFLVRSTKADAVRRELEAIHPGFRTSASVVLHHFGTHPEYRPWRIRWVRNDEGLAHMTESPETELKQVQRLVAESDRSTTLGRSFAVKGASLSLSGRNPPPLLGAGLIDAIPDEVLIRAEREASPASGLGRNGHANRLPGGKIGRFGWKAQIASLDEFVLTACANELGLEVPEHHQAPLPLDPDATPKGLDLTREECDDLVAFVRQLGTPAGSTPASTPVVESGRKRFEAVGCASCHRPTLGDIEGLYSDLLLHDMGPDLADAGQYYGMSPPGSPAGALGSEWRTPPLWGFRDSAPYLHDGRAKDLDEAVALHGGEGATPAKRYFALLPKERLEVQAFLRSLSVPDRIKEREK